ncbi:DUF2236 domain-containing protein [Pseudenhygromyxa sp. WMMC2535]|uniref:oxygenase MpaB family protein n=1 Tax=Pseudenhygromyxa sp. WMMC2535 TaxID=2712867 RepID=UPI001557ED14|nr:oxygenase MpaB family protein [Pseudenhygromyxa sp. WMMC2535]NVB42522.1 DUF2236 domain-containing protein [Pseudenhygromyxa sp. WMMC2535]
MILRRDGSWERRIDALDPIEDCEEIVDILSNHVFPLDVFVATELAQLRTFTIPTISRLLHATGEYEKRGGKRVDDTKLVLTEIFDPGLDTAAGAEMISHLNRIHGVYRIANDDFIYTLSVFTIDVDEWLARWGWRAMRANERAALYELYRRLGERMQIRDLPATFAEMLAWRRAYEARAQRYDPANEAVADGLLRALAELVGPARPLVSSAVRTAFIGDEALAILGLERPGAGVRAAWTGALRLRQRAGRHLATFQTQRFWDSAIFRRSPTYPEGYERMRLGPSKLLARFDAASAA